jgi:hypothetical protein
MVPESVPFTSTIAATSGRGDSSLRVFRQPGCCGEQGQLGELRSPCITLQAVPMTKLARGFDHGRGGACQIIGLCHVVYKLE